MMIAMGCYATGVLVVEVRIRWQVAVVIPRCWGISDGLLGEPPKSNCPGAPAPGRFMAWRRITVVSAVGRRLLIGTASTGTSSHGVKFPSTRTRNIVSPPRCADHGRRSGYHDRAPADEADVVADALAAFARAGWLAALGFAVIPDGASLRDEAAAGLAGAGCRAFGRDTRRPAEGHIPRRAVGFVVGPVITGGAGPIVGTVGLALLVGDRRATEGGIDGGGDIVRLAGIRRAGVIDDALQLLHVGQAPVVVARDGRWSIALSHSGAASRCGRRSFWH